MASDRIRCEECEKEFSQKDMLVAPNPFDADDTVIGCPNCLSVIRGTLLCEVPGCSETATCGTPTANGGYAQTCGNHRPVENKGIVSWKDIPPAAKGAVISWKNI